ncbi:MAG TPA: NlpC/P60 family protein [Kineosporiaceae bacterium]|nr:NlpC/P60 family protein [Kineosporiaceae bacterium]
MPIGALMTAGALVLAGNASATAVQPTANTSASTGGNSLDEAAVAGEVPATAKASDTETVRQTRKATAKATKKLTSKVKTTSKATVKATRSGKGSATVEATRYAPTYEAALAEAEEIAKDAAHERAVAAAKSRAGKLALARAKAVAKHRARVKVKTAVRAKFGRMVIKRAAAQRGKPYRWGATGPRAFDCSGYVTYVMKGVGVKNLPRTSSAMAKKAKRVSKSHRKVGDLVFFTSGGRVSHVAVYAGHGKIWHTPGSGRSVTKVKIWTSSYRVGRVPA